MPKFDEDGTLDYICSDILSPKTRNDVREELKCHIDDIAECSMATGMDEQAARADALKRLGNPAVLRSRLGSVHADCSLSRMSSALTVLFWGFLLTSFNLNIFNIPYITEIVSTAASILMLSALFRLRTVNKALRTAFYLFSAEVSIYTVFGAVSRAFEAIESLNIAFIVAVCALTVSAYIAMFAGLQTFANKYSGEGMKKVNFIPSVICMIITYAVLCIAWLEKADTAAMGVNIQSAFLAAIGAAGAIWALINMRRARKILWDADEVYNIGGRDSKHTALVVCAAVILACLPLSSMYVGAHPLKRAQELNTCDCATPALHEKAQEVRTSLINMGLPNDIADELADSEILRYENASSMAYGTYYGEVNYRTFCFYIPDDRRESVPGYLRILWCIDAKPTGLYDGFYFGSPGNYILTNSAYASTVFSSGGKKYSGIIKNATNVNSNNRFPYDINIFEAHCDKGAQSQRIYFSQNLDMENDLDMYFAVYGQSIHRKTWLDYSSADIFSAAGTSDTAEKGVTYYTKDKVFVKYNTLGAGFSVSHYPTGKVTADTEE